MTSMAICTTADDTIINNGGEGAGGLGLPLPCHLCRAANMEHILQVYEEAWYWDERYREEVGPSDCCSASTSHRTTGSSSSGVGTPGVPSNGRQHKDI